MELHRFFNHRSWNKAFLEKLSRFSGAREKTKTGASRVSAQTLQNLKGMAAVFLGLILAFMAHQYSLSEGENDFDARTWPHEKAWISLLKDFRFASAPVAQNAALLQNHPNPYQPKTDIWLRSDQNVIYLGQSPYQANQPELWVRPEASLPSSVEKKAAPLNWIHLGPGIRAFNELVNQIQTQKTPALKRNWVDPKEIRY